MDATLRDSTFFDYYNAVVEDAIAAYRQDLHEAALLIQRARHQVLRVDELLALWGVAGDAGQPVDAIGTAAASL